MRTIIVVLWLIVLSFSADKFGGIGIAFYQVGRGVAIAAVAEDSPADQAGLLEGDCIVAVDGVGLAGKSLAASKNLLRGNTDRLLNLIVVRNSKWIELTVKRVQMEVIALSTKNTSASKENLSVVAKKSASEGYELLDIVQTKGNNTGVFIEKSKQQDSDDYILSTPLIGASLQFFSRSQIVFTVKEEGAVKIKIFTLEGSLLISLNEPLAKAGYNRFQWEGTHFSAGQYMIQLNQGGKTSGFLGVLK